MGGTEEEEFAVGGGLGEVAVGGDEAGFVVGFAAGGAGAEVHVGGGVEGVVGAGADAGVGVVFDLRVC